MGTANQAGSGCGDSFVGRCQGNAYVATRGRTVEVSRRNQDSQTSQEFHRSMAVLITGGPQVDGPLRVLDSEADGFEGRPEYGATLEVPLALLLDMIMICEQFDHRLLDRTRNQHPRVLADQKQICHYISITGDEARAVARHVRAFGE